MKGSNSKGSVVFPLYIFLEDKDKEGWEKKVKVLFFFVKNKHTFFD
jgi:hypothetical protein